MPNLLPAYIGMARIPHKSAKCRPTLAVAPMCCSYCSCATGEKFSPFLLKQCSHAIHPPPCRHEPSPFQVLLDETVGQAVAKLDLPDSALLASSDGAIYPGDAAFASLGLQDDDQVDSFEGRGVGE